MSEPVGYIYRLTMGDKFYIGSTQMSLELRRYLHIKNAEISKYKDTRKIFKAINSVPADSVKIEALHELKGATKDALLQLENTLIRQNLSNPLCCNTSRPIGLTPKEWREANIEKVKAIQNTKHTCLCKGRYTTSNRAVHMKSIRHQTWLKHQTTPAAPPQASSGGDPAFSPAPPAFPLNSEGCPPVSVPQP